MGDMGLNFDKREKELNVLINEYIKCKKDLKWFNEEIKLHDERLANIDAELFFLQIHKYILHSYIDLLDMELDQE